MTRGNPREERASSPPDASSELSSLPSLSPPPEDPPLPQSPATSKGKGRAARASAAAASASTQARPRGRPPKKSQLSAEQSKATPTPTHTRKRAVLTRSGASTPLSAPSSSPGRKRVHAAVDEDAAPAKRPRGRPKKTASLAETSVQAVAPRRTSGRLQKSATPAADPTPKAKASPATSKATRTRKMSDSPLSINKPSPSSSKRHSSPINSPLRPASKPAALLRGVYREDDPSADMYKVTQSDVDMADGSDSDSDADLGNMSFNDLLNRRLDAQRLEVQQKPADFSQKKPGTEKAAIEDKGMPPGVHIGADCLLYVTTCWFVAHLLGYDADKRRFHVVMSNGDEHKVLRDRLIFWRQNQKDEKRLSSVTLGELKGVKITRRSRQPAKSSISPESAPFASLSYAQQVHQLCPHLVRLMNEEYPPAQWRIDNFRNWKRDGRYLQRGDMSPDDEAALRAAIVLEMRGLPSPAATFAPLLHLTDESEQVQKAEGAPADAPDADARDGTEEDCAADDEQNESSNGSRSGHSSHATVIETPTQPLLQFDDVASPSAIGTGAGTPLDQPPPLAIAQSGVFREETMTGTTTSEVGHTPLGSKESVALAAPELARLLAESTGEDRPASAVAAHVKPADEHLAEQPADQPFDRALTPLSPSLVLVPTSPATDPDAPVFPASSPPDSPGPLIAAADLRSAPLWELSGNDREDFVTDVLLLEVIVAIAMRCFPTEGTEEEQYRAAIEELNRLQREDPANRWGFLWSDARMAIERAKDRKRAEEERERGAVRYTRSNRAIRLMRYPS